MQKYERLLIGGEWIETESGKTFPTFNPATGEELAQVPLAGQAEVDKAVEAAVKAFPAWAGRTQAERSKILFQVAAEIRKNARELIELEVSEHGTPVNLATGFIMGSAEAAEYSASIGKAMMGEVIPAIPDTLSYLQRVPVGVCACITPWNVPALMMVSMLTPALAVGNTCILKPASVNSLLGIKFTEVFEKAGLPAGTVNLITGPGSSIGKALCTHPGVDLIRFTGASDTGKDIMANASSTVKKVVMELGGNNPVIITEDADIDKAVQAHAIKHFGNTSQNCSTPGRYYVHEKVYDEFVEKFISETNKITVGDPGSEKTMMGPMTNKQQWEKVKYYIQSAKDEGARVVECGRNPDNFPVDKGFFLMPTVVVDVTHDMTIAREEIFGPAACILKYSSGDDVVELANDTRFGLCAVIWTKDMAKGMRYINDLRVDSAYLNMPRTAVNELPWGGDVKESGIGKSDSMCGMEELTDLKLVCIAYGE